MATATISLPNTARHPRSPSRIAGAGRASFPNVYYLKRIDNSRLRREVDPEKRRECFSLLGLGILVFLFGLLFAWQHFECVRDGYQIEQRKAERAALEEWNRQLRLEQASLADPARIDALARKELGLVPPGPRQMIPLGDAASPAQVESPQLARNFTFAGGEAAPEP